jgi:hypothetical protein
MKMKFACIYMYIIYATANLTMHCYLYEEVLIC